MCIRDRPFDAVDLDDAPAGEPISRLGARDVIGIAVVDDLRAAAPILTVELERAGADRLGDRLHRVGLGVGLAHDDGDLADGGTQREGHQRHRPLQLEAEGGVVHHFHACLLYTSRCV